MFATSVGIAIVATEVFVNKHSIMCVRRDRITTVAHAYRLNFFYAYSDAAGLKRNGVAILWNWFFFFFNRVFYFKYCWISTIKHLIVLQSELTFGTKCSSLTDKSRTKLPLSRVVCRVSHCNSRFKGAISSFVIQFDDVGKSSTVIGWTDLKIELSEEFFASSLNLLFQIRLISRVLPRVQWVLKYWKLSKNVFRLLNWLF